MMEKSPEWIIDNPIAHRGLWNENDAPENTLRACERAIANGYAIEIDVRMTADKQIVVFHDATLSRMTGHGGVLRCMNYGDMKDLQVADSDQNISLLTEILEIIDGRAPVFVEIKSSYFSAHETMILVCDVLSQYKGRVAVMGFDPRIVRWWDKLDVRNGVDKSVPVSQLFHDESYFKRVLCIIIWIAFGSPGQFLAVPVSALRAGFFTRRRRFGWKTLAWTVRSQADADMAKEYADNLIFDAFEGYASTLKD